MLVNYFQFFYYFLLYNVFFVSLLNKNHFSVQIEFQYGWFQFFLFHISFHSFFFVLYNKNSLLQLVCVGSFSFVQKRCVYDVRVWFCLCLRSTKKSIHNSKCFPLLFYSVLFVCFSLLAFTFVCVLNFHYLFHLNFLSII